MSISGILGNIPTGLRDELVSALTEIERNFREHRWEPAELNGGKLCEIVHTILRGYVDGNFPAKATKPSNMVDACKALEKDGKAFSRSVAIQIPRMLMALYEIRNNRGVGHVGGDVGPNHMDAVCVLQMSKWVVAELIRLFHNVSTIEASQIVDAISDREISIIWNINGVKRVLDPSMTMLNKTLVIAYSSSAPVSERDLVTYLEHSNAAVYRRDVLRPAHKQRLIEYDASLKTVHISPLGAKRVEKEILG